jgi:dTDP-4-dehydrorhamnose 3,5-epimerase
MGCWKMIENLLKPALVKGGKVTDDRGSLSFVNDLDLSNVKRFYTVQNHSMGFIRAWHGHLLESKIFIVLQGSILACAVRMTDTKNPDKDVPVEKFVLSSDSPTALYIPKGFANGFMNLSADAILLVLSSTSLEESKNDDYRFAFDYWDPWKIEQR